MLIPPAGRAADPMVPMAADEEKSANISNSENVFDYIERFYI